MRRRVKQTGLRRFAGGGGKADWEAPHPPPGAGAEAPAADQTGNWM